MTPNNLFLGSRLNAASMKLCVVAMIPAIVLSCKSAGAQADFEKGFQGYQSYHGSDFDVVNLANGNLMLDIPLISYEQRGGLPPIVISIRSNSTTFQSTPPYLNGPPDTKQHEVASGIVGSPWGQPHVVISPGGLSWKEERVTTSSHTSGGGPEYLTRFVALDESGATHSLGGGVANLGAGVVPGIRYSVDGSGLMLQPGNAQTGPLLVDRNGNIGGLIDTNGNSIVLNGQCAKPAGSGDFFDPSLASWEGYAHGIASATSIVDSIGRVIQNPSYLPPSVPYSCIIDLDASYHPAKPDANGCETWAFPGENNVPVDMVFCYQQIPIASMSGAPTLLPVPFASGTPTPNGGLNTQACPSNWSSKPLAGGEQSISCEPINESWWVLTSVTLPNLTKWQFAYDGYGQVKTVTMPTGATVSYQYQPRLACGNPPGEVPLSGVPTWPYSNLMSSRTVVSRTLDANDSNGPLTWTYSSTIGSGWVGNPNSGTVKVTDPGQLLSGNVLVQNDTVHTFALNGLSVCGPYETKTQYYEGPVSGAKLLKEVDTLYYTGLPDFANPTNFSNYITVGVLPKLVTTYIPAAQLVRQDYHAYDALGTYQDYNGLVHAFSFGQLQLMTESDWVAGTPSNCLPATTCTSPFRSTLHTRLWQSNGAYFAHNLIDLPCLDIVLVGAPPSQAQTSCVPPTPSSTQISQTSYGYDETAYSFAASLGNATSVSRWLQGGTPVTTHSMYLSSSHGLPTQKLDANGNPTSFVYDSTGLFPKEVIYPATTSGTPHTEYFTYDGNTGLLVKHIDQNSQTTMYQYDSMRRLSSITFPDTGVETYSYNDAIHSSPTSLTPSFQYTKTLLVGSSQEYTASGIADGLGRMIQTRVTAPEGLILKDTTYDNLGRVAAVSNPYLTKTDPTYGVTYFAFDALGRKVLQTQPDLSTRSWCYSGLQDPYHMQYCSTNTSGPTDWVDGQDELGHNTQSRSDGLGRLVGVTDPNGVAASYTYNRLGDLLTVSQPGAAGETARSPRTFTYDTLSRLITSTNPETGTICYGQWSSGVCIGGYDPNGNLLYKTDARGITVSYSYDALNRLLSKSYIGDTTGTASSCYQYDVSSLPPPSLPGYLIGRLSNAWTQVGACPGAASPPAFPSSTILTRRSILAYDTMGHVLNEQQCTRTNCATPNSYTPSYTYDLAGNITTHSNGIASGTGVMNFTNCYDIANRLSLVVSVTTPCLAPSYAASMRLFTAPSYSPAGGLTKATFGTGLQLSRTYDTRLRISTETDTGNNPAQNPTPSSATIQILGNTDQTH